MRLRAIAETETERDFDIVRTIVYRSELFGAPFSDCLQESLRGPSDWSVGERELFAAFVSSVSQCPF